MNTTVSAETKILEDETLAGLAMSSMAAVGSCVGLPLLYLAVRFGPKIFQLVSGFLGKKSRGASVDQEQQMQQIINNNINIGSTLEQVASDVRDLKESSQGSPASSFSAAPAPSEV
jgi:hypothetical protein